MTEPRRFLGIAIVLVSVCAFAWALVLVDGSLARLFLTPDQRGQRLMDRGDPAGAARFFEDPLRRGVAQYRAGEFKVAAASFGQDDSPEALYDRANALVMLGEYASAIASYGHALAKKPGWKEAKENMELAQHRLERLHPPHEGDQGTGGRLPPDKIVFDKKAGQASPDQKETVTGAPQRMSDAELRAMWLRRVQTRPEDFLRAKFSYQAARETGSEEKK